MGLIDLKNAFKGHYSVFNGTVKPLTRDFSHMAYNAIFQIRRLLLGSEVPRMRQFFDYLHLHLIKSVPHLTIAFSKAKRPQLPVSPKLAKQIQDVFCDLEVSEFASLGSSTDTVLKCIAKCVILWSTESPICMTLMGHLLKNRRNWKLFQLQHRKRFGHFTLEQGLALQPMARVFFDQRCQFRLRERDDAREWKSDGHVKPDTDIETFVHF
ncbi:hypothetical protein TNCV_3670471 [Trichonephila clavipes]|nr:hypothetical protein TNCV_3670471 [Trichonephila clavipes]